ncbi:MAG: DUF503 domain-containing protein [Candidatus Zixiibacteriota bacterium]
MSDSFKKDFLKHLELDEESAEAVSQKYERKYDDDVDMNFIIGIRSFELFVPESNSLKQKRFVIKSLRERLKARFNVSIAETDFQNLWQRSMLVVVTISNEVVRAEKLLSKVNEFVEHDSRLIVIDSKMKFL